MVMKKTTSAKAKPKAAKKPAAKKKAVVKKTAWTYSLFVIEVLVYLLTE